MCDRHKQKALDHYCLEHELVICAQCATEEHAQTPCESMPVIEASRHVVPQYELELSELRKLKMVSQSILDGNRQEETLRTVAEAEALLDKFVEEVKQKFKKAKSLLHPFSELSREEMWKLKAVISKKLPNGPHVRETEDLHEARDLVMRLQEVRKQTKDAKETLNSLPNYAEVTVNQDYLHSLSFDGNPIHIKKLVDADESVDELADDSTSFLSTTQESVYLIEKSSFTIEHCTDIAIMNEHYVIASVGDSVQKRERKRMSFRQGISVPSAGKVCVIGETTEVSVLQEKTGHIVVIETEPNLEILYRLNANKQFVDISYLESVIGSEGCPKQSPVFVVCYRTHDNNYVTENIDLIKPKPTKYPGNPPTFLTSDKTIADTLFHTNKSRFRGVSNVSAFQNRYIVVGASKGVTCINKNGTMIWTIDLFKRVAQILAYRTLIFVAVRDERKIITIGKQGHVIDENILPPMDLYPHKMSAYEDQLIVKYTGLFKWANFKKMYEMVG